MTNITYLSMSPMPTITSLGAWSSSNATLAAVLDLFSRFVVGWAIKSRLQ